VNLRATKREMPVRYWQSLPEAVLVPELVREAAARTDTMIARQAPLPSPARPLVEAAATLPALREEARRCTACPLYKDATATVFGEGREDARLMLVGEQPGDEEDRAGRPFVGPAGRLLDELLAEAGVPRGELYITNAVKHFKFVPAPRGKRRLHQKPSYGEVTACKPWLEAEVAHVRPQVILALGATAGQAFLGATFRLTRALGGTSVLPEGPRLVATYHPSAILRMPDPEARERGREQLVRDLRRAFALAAA
jgi:DNA polymerase